MQSQYKWAIRVLGLGLAVAPLLAPVAHAEDQPSQTPPAQKPHHGNGGGLARFHEAVMSVNPTADQKPKIETAFADAKTKMEAAVKTAGEDRDARRAAVGPIMKELHTAIEGILTPDQQAALKTYMEQHRPARGQGNGQGNNNK